MSKATDLLYGLTDEEISVLTSGNGGEEHIVIDNTRKIFVPEALKRIAVQYDHNIETVTFDCPRYWDGIDMSEMSIYINYKLSNGTQGCYVAKNVRIDDVDSSIIHFDWTISNNVTFIKGNITFLVCIKKTDAEGNEVTHWNTELNKDLYVSEGLECADTIVSEHPDVITYILEKLDSLTMSNVAGQMTAKVYGSNYKMIAGESTMEE